MVKGRPLQPPIGRQLARTAKVVSRAFDEALIAAGGSLSTWLVLVSLKQRQLANQRELAEAVGIREATLTHHLHAMEADGLITRRRDSENRRIQRVELTSAGESAFERLRDEASAFDRRLRAGISEAEVTKLARILHRLEHNVTGAT